MNLDEAKELWSSEHESSTRTMSAHTLSESEILRLVKEQSEAFDKRIWRRDLLESIAALAVFLLFGWMLQDPSWIVRTGALIVMGGSVYIYWRLQRARTRHTLPFLNRPVAEVLRTERAKVDEQIHLLKNVLWWYIAPIAIGVLMVAIGQNGWTEFTIVYAAVVLLASAGIYALNQRAVRRCLQPRREKLTRLLEQVEEGAEV